MVRFQRFVDLAITKTGGLGPKEIEVARWCLSPTIAQDEAYNRRRKAIIQNFAGKGAPRSVDDLKHRALNGADDLWLMTSAAFMERRGLQGIPQDIWIVTYDKKLAEYCRVFSYLPAGNLTGFLAVCTSIPSEHDSGYWQQSAQWFYEFQRRPRQDSQDEDHAKLELVRRCETLVETFGSSKFSSLER